MRFRLFSAALALASVAAAACSSNNPVRPSMSFTAPAAQLPSTGTAYNYSQQPIALTIFNVVRTGGATVTYNVEVSSSPAFASTVFTANGVAEGAGGASGVTTVTLPTLDGATYYWRSRAVVDGVIGEASPVVSFIVRPRVVLQAPVLTAPAQNAPVFNTRPTFTIQNAARTGQPAAVTYDFQVSASISFATLAASATVAEQPENTSWTPSTDLPAGTLYWRARASDAVSGATSPFSNASSFDRRGIGSDGDQLDLSTVTVVLGPQNIATWPIRSTVTDVVAENGTVCIGHTKLDSWPGTIFFDDPAVLVAGNQWMFAFIGGKWYGGAGRWYRPGQACKSTSSDDGFTGTFYMEGAEPLRNYVPRNGDLVGLMSATPNRFWPAMSTLNERSNVVVVRWGG